MSGVGARVAAEAMDHIGYTDDLCLITMSSITIGISSYTEIVCNCTWNFMERLSNFEDVVL